MLFADHALTVPWTLCPMTTDLAQARERPESWTDVSGVEGVAVKGMPTVGNSGYQKRDLRTRSLAPPCRVPSGALL